MVPGRLFLQAADGVPRWTRALLGKGRRDPQLITISTPAILAEDVLLSAKGQAEGLGEMVSVD